MAEYKPFHEENQGANENITANELLDGFDWNLEAEQSAQADWWRAQGPYAGVGPVRREGPGDPLQDELYRRLAANGQLDASRIELLVDACQVTLSGHVPTRRGKRLAEAITASVPGVQSITDRLEVDNPGPLAQG
jgi:hypothetical protein